jgi:hypothetical protein
MGRKKAKDQESVLSHRVRLRLNQKTIKRLEGIAASSNCRSVAEVARMILSNEKITVFHKDISLEGPIQELIKIRSELRAIGVNINQITHFFHSADTVNQKMFHALKVGENYREVGDKVNALVEMVAVLGEKWLQR